MYFRVKDLLITSLAEPLQQRGEEEGNCPICSCTVGTVVGDPCCCPGWTGPGTTCSLSKGVEAAGLGAFHLTALRAEIRAAVAAELGRSAQEPAKETVTPAALKTLETKLSAALEEVRSKLKDSK